LSFHFLYNFHQIISMKMGIDFGGFPGNMADNRFRYGQLHAGADSSGDEGMPELYGIMP